MHGWDLATSTPLLLGVLAVVLAGPVPAGLARLRWLRRTPRAAMLLWQSVALAAVLAAVGSGLSLATGHLWDVEVGPLNWVVAIVAVLLTALVVGRLLYSGHRVGTRLRQLRREHRELVDLVGRRRESPELRILEHELPVAYCLPGLAGGRVVVSAGALASLAPAEVEAVLAHEKAHLRARHDLVLEAFSVLHAAFPRWVSSASALEETRFLVEVLADRAACVRTGGSGRNDLAQALVAMAATSVPSVRNGAALGSVGGAGAQSEAHSSGALVARVRLLADRGPHRIQSALLLAVAVAVLILPTFFVAWPWLNSLR